MAQQLKILWKISKSYKIIKSICHGRDSNPGVLGTNDLKSFPLNHSGTMAVCEVFGVFGVFGGSSFLDF